MPHSSAFNHRTLIALSSTCNCSWAQRGNTTLVSLLKHGSLKFIKGSIEKLGNATDSRDREVEIRYQLLEVVGFVMVRGPVWLVIANFVWLL